jgi:hypothetical protein
MRNKGMKDLQEIARQGKTLTYEQAQRLKPNNHEPTTENTNGLSRNSS